MGGEYRHQVSQVTQLNTASMPLSECRALREKVNRMVDEVFGDDSEEEEEEGSVKDTIKEDKEGSVKED